MRKYFIGFYRKCDFITMTSIISSLIGILCSIYSHYTYAVLCLIICGLCDAFDGKVARMHSYSKEQKIYGQELDSLSDVIAFGVFPALLTCFLSQHLIVYILAIIYVLFGVIRLAYFNMLVQVDSKNSKSFIGVPITTISIVYPLFFLILRFLNFDLIEYILPVILLIQGISFIVRIKIPKYDFVKIITKILAVVFSKYLMLFFWFPIFIFVCGNIFFDFTLSDINISNQFLGHLRPMIFIFLWISALNGAIYLLFGNSNKSKMFMIILTLILLIINDIKFMIMRKPLELSDINYLNPDNVKMMGNATTTIGSWIWMTIFKSFGYLLISSIFMVVDWKRCIKPKKRVLSVIGGSLLFLVFLLPLLSNVNVNKFLLDKVYSTTVEDVSNYAYNVDLYKEYGFYQGFMLNSISNFYLEPSGYSLDACVKALDAASDYSNEKNKKANVVFILSESFTDMPKISKIKFDKPLTSNIDKFRQMDNANVSDLLVTSYGGASVNTEFQILTGASLYFWKDGFIPYNQYYNDYNGSVVPNIIKEFNNNGYTTEYLTPWGRSSFNSEYVYKLFGTDKLTYDSDLSGNKKGYYYDDESLMNDILNELKSSKDGEYKFIMSATGENHYPFKGDKFDKYDLKVVESDYTDEESANLLSYAQGIYDADRTLKILYDEIQKLDTPTIVVFYGDHFPYITNDAGEEVYIKSDYFTGDDNMIDVLKHTTPVVIFSNYGVKFNDLSYINASYLGAYILNKLDLNISNYFKYIDKTRKEVPVFNKSHYFNFDTNEFEQLSSAPKNITDAIETYKFVQYYKFYELGI